MSQRLSNDVSIASHVCLRPARIDDIAAIRYVHAMAMRACASQLLIDADVEHLTDFISQEDYIHALVADELTAAWVGDELVGTVAWKRAATERGAVRLHKLFVWPMFARAGVGRLLVSHAEAQAHAAGFRSARVRTSTHQAAFFKRLGYVMKAQSAVRTPSGAQLPIAYLRKDGIRPAWRLADTRWSAPHGMYHH